MGAVSCVLVRFDEWTSGIHQKEIKVNLNHTYIGMSPGFDGIVTRKKVKVPKIFLVNGPVRLGLIHYRRRIPVDFLMDFSSPTIVPPIITAGGSVPNKNRNM